MNRQISMDPKIRPDIHKLIKSSHIDNIQYTFIENKKGNLIKFRQVGSFEINHFELRLNDALKPLLEDLIQTKFSKISSESKIKMRIIVQDVDDEIDEPNGLGLTLKIEINNNGKYSENIIYDHEVFILSNSDTKQYGDIIHSFLMKFIIGTDKYLNNEFEVQ
jgi:hypothetical protein